MHSHWTCLLHIDTNAPTFTLEVDSTNWLMSALKHFSELVYESHRVMCRDVLRGKRNSGAALFRLNKPMCPELT